MHREETDDDTNWIKLVPELCVTRGRCEKSGRPWAPGHTCPWPERREAGGCRGILFVQPFVFYKFIFYGSSVKEPRQDEEENGAQNGWVTLRSLALPKCRPEQPQTQRLILMNSHKAGFAVQGWEGMWVAWLEPLWLVWGCGQGPLPGGKLLCGAGPGVETCQGCPGLSG